MSQEKSSQASAGVAKDAVKEASQAKPSASTASTDTPRSADSTKPVTAAGARASAHTPQPPWRGAWGAMVVGLVLVVAILGTGLWWQQQRFETVAQEVASRLAQSDQSLTTVTQRATQALSLANAQREVVDQLGRELSATQSELQTLQQAWQAANAGLDQTLLLNDLKRLIDMANQELTLFGNVTSAVSILASVDSMLKAQPSAPLKNLQRAVGTDLARLRAAPQVDVADLSAKLDSLIELSGQAPLLSPQGQITRLDAQAGSAASDEQTSQPAGDPDATGTGAAPTAHDPGAKPEGASWWSWWSNTADTVTDEVQQWTSTASTVLLREFADVMSIRKADDPQALLLSEEQAIQLRGNIRSMLLSAQLALMTRQADIWQSELTEVQSLLNTRFDRNALDTKASLRLITDLLDAPVASEVPPIDNTLAALASAQRALSIPADASQSSSAKPVPDPDPDPYPDHSATDSYHESTGPSVTSSHDGSRQGN